MVVMSLVMLTLQVCELKTAVLTSVWRPTEWVRSRMEHVLMFMVNFMICKMKTAIFDTSKLSSTY
jgi:hypothetical protein